jgi:subtilisin family serine protease
MAMKLKLLFLFLIFHAYFIGISQEDAWVYFTDKTNVEFHLNNPNTILTQQALNRKAQFGIVIDERDVPVNEVYISQIKNQTGISVLAKSKWFNAIHVRGEEEDINNLEALDFVESVEFANQSLNTNSRLTQLNNKFEIENTQTNYNYGNTVNQVTMISVDQLHQQGFTGDGIIIAVLDSGFSNVNEMAAFQNLRINGKLLDGYDYVDRTDDVYTFTGNDHGTKVLSDMAGFIEDEFVGTAPNASYYLFRTEDIFSENPVEESYWVEAAERADSLGVHIINSSLGYTTYDRPEYSYTPSQMNGTTAFISKGASIAAQKGILVVNSAGNSGHVSWETVGAPADSPDVFSIGAVDSNGDYAFFSSVGSSAQPTQKPDVVARGLSTIVINDQNNIITNSGTSFSAPLVAGALACLMQALPNKSPEQIKQLVRESSSQFSAPDNFLGFGIPNFSDALQLGLSVGDEQPFQINLFPNPVKDNLFITKSFAAGRGEILIYNQLGKMVYRSNVFENYNQINLSDWTSGIYILKLNLDSISKQFKIIKL